MSTTVPLEKALCLIPFNYGDEPDAIEHPDKYIHSGAEEAALYSDGGVLLCPDLPSVYEYATEASSSPMHFQTIADGFGNRYIPMFTSFEAMTDIFGIRIRVALICYKTAKKYCLTEDIAGIVIGPGTIDEIITRETIEEESKNV